MKTQIIQVRGGQDEAAARRGAEILSAGGLVGFATETVYGIAAAASNADAMERLRELKSRPSRPFSVHIGSPKDAHRYVRRMPILAQRLIDKAWPGPVTLLTGVGGRLADDMLENAGLYKVLCHKDVIGLRCPRMPVTQAMLSAVDGPVVAPSANLAGQPSPRNADEVLASLDGRIDLLLDSGPTCYGKDSTIVLLDPSGWNVVREGVYDQATIRKLLSLTLLFVCTGNTCRSPMAEGFARKFLCNRLKCRPAELSDKGYEVLSAGIFAGEGGNATPEAVSALRQLGADISAHRTRKLTSELIAAADMIFCMTDFHVSEVRRIAPQAAAKVQRVDAEGEIPDPVGGTAEEYLQTARTIQKAVTEVLTKRTP